MDPVDQKKLAEIRQLVLSRPDIFSHQGTVVTTSRRHHGKTLGPYFRLAFREGGRQCSRYLGRSRPLADAVQSLLDEQQQPGRRCRQLRQLRRAARARLRTLRRLIDRELRQCGLRLQGAEVRGWRNHLTARKDKFVDQQAESQCDRNL